MRKKKVFKGILTAMAACMAMSFPLAASASERWESTTSRDEDNNICIDFEEVQVHLPASWSGKCQMGTSEDGVSFYQTKSRELWTKELGFPNGGWLFSINFSQTNDFWDNPSYMTLGSGSDGIYYVTFPTDMQAYTEDAAALAEFQSMANDVDWITENITITSDGSWIDIYGSEEYIFQQSATAYLSKEDLAGLSADEIQMAINEIYARHHRKFVLQEVQDYFNSKSWYSGTIEAADFEVSVMNIYECANINLMVDYLKNFKSN